MSAIVPRLPKTFIGKAFSEENRTTKTSGDYSSKSFTKLLARHVPDFRTLTIGRNLTERM